MDKCAGTPTLAYEFSMAMQDTRTDKTPQELGFAMPAEWERTSHLAGLAPQSHRLARTSSIPSAGSMGRSWPQDCARRNRPPAGGQPGRGETRPALSDPSRSGPAECRVHRASTNRGWMRDSGPIFVRRARRSRSYLEPNPRPGLQPSRQSPCSPKRRSSISISMPGPSMTIGRKTGACRTWLPAVLGKPLFHAQCRGRAFVLEGGGHRGQWARHASDHRRVLPRPESPGPQPRPGPGGDSSRHSSSTWA